MQSDWHVFVVPVINESLEAYNTVGIVGCVDDIGIAMNDIVDAADAVDEIVVYVAIMWMLLLTALRES